MRVTPRIDIATRAEEDGDSNHVEPPPSPAPGAHRERKRHDEQVHEEVRHQVWEVEVDEVCGVHRPERRLGVAERELPPESHRQQEDADEDRRNEHEKRHIDRGELEGVIAGGTLIWNPAGGPPGCLRAVVVG